MGSGEPDPAGERALLAAFLDDARHAVITTLIGVPVALLREPLISPDSSSLLGVVRHLTHLERWWFAHTFAGLDVAIETGVDSPHGGWALDRSDTPWTVVGRYQDECQRSRRISEHAAMDDLARRPAPDGRRVVLRWVMLRMIEATNRHAGQADVLRHLIVGTTSRSRPPSPAARPFHRRPDPARGA